MLDVKHAMRRAHLLMALTHLYGAFYSLRIALECVAFDAVASWAKHAVQNR